MNMKIVAFGGISKNSLIIPIPEKITVGKPGYSMWNRFNDEQIAKIPDLLRLKDVMRNGEPYRWMHTEHMIQSLYLLYGAGMSEKESYHKFIDGRGSEGEHYLSISQFNEIKSFLLKTISDQDDFRFLEYIIATHDIGCIYGEAKHFIRSGEMSTKIFKELGFSDDMAEIARTVNGNHSLLGDIILGEGAPAYAVQVYRDLAALSVKAGKSADYGWKMLFILNAIDVHSAYRGFLTRQKVQDLQYLKDIDALITIDSDWIANRMVMLGIGSGEFVPEVKNVYLQYCYDRLQDMGSEQVVVLLNRLSLLDKELKTEMPGKFFCITFKSGKNHDESIMERFVSGKYEVSYNRNFIPYKAADGNMVLLEGKVCGLPFAITSDGYLEIDDTPKANLPISTWLASTPALRLDRIF